MAEIYRGKMVGPGGFEKPVVIKKILPRLSRDERFIKMLVNEAKINASLSHANIVQIHDLGLNEEGEYFLVLEYVNGRDLRAILDSAREQKVSISRECGLFVGGEVCEALEHAHRLRGPDGQPLGLVHRDVSPANILVSVAGEVKLTDFGIAKPEQDASVVTTLKGKFSYMSPEQARSMGIDQTSDLFSLGVILFEMLLGRRLFNETGEFETLQAVRECRIPKPRDLDPLFPEELEQILLKVLSMRPRDRYQSAAEFGAKLREFRFSLSSAGGGAAELAALVQRVFPPSARRDERAEFITLNSIVGFRTGDGSMPTPTPLSISKLTELPPAEVAASMTPAFEMEPTRVAPDPIAQKLGAAPAPFEMSDSVLGGRPPTDPKAGDGKAAAARAASAAAIDDDLRPTQRGGEDLLRRLAEAAKRAEIEEAILAGPAVGGGATATGGRGGTSADDSTTGSVVVTPAPETLADSDGVGVAGAGGGAASAAGPGAAGPGAISGAASGKRSPAEAAALRRSAPPSDGMGRRSPVEAAAARRSPLEGAAARRPSSENARAAVEAPARARGGRGNQRARTARVAALSGTGALPPVEAGSSRRGTGILLALVIGVATGAGAFAYWRSRPLPTTVLRVESDPPGAQVLIDGVSLPAPTPLRATVARDGQDHDIELRLADRWPYQARARVDGDEVRLSASLELSHVPVEIRSRPPGARARIDGAGECTTPCVLEQVETRKQHEVWLELPGFSSWHNRLDVSPQGVPPLDVPLVAASGAAPAAGGPDAAANAPGSPEAAGARRVEEARPEVSHRLRGATGEVVLKSEPWARILVDGKDIGRNTSAAMFKLPLGKHEITLVNPPLRLRRTFSIVVRPEEPTRRFVSLR